MALPTLILFDTTAFSQDSMLNSAAWDSLSSAAKSGLIEIAVSEVTIAELSRQVSEKADKARESIASDAAFLDAHGISLQEWVAPPAHEFDLAFRARLTTRGVRVRPLPSIGHADLLRRDLASRLPFDRSGRGYRDALIWHTFLEWLDERTDCADACLVTANSKDFANKGKDSLSLELVTELPTGTTVQLLRNVADAASKARELKKLSSAETGPQEEEITYEVSASALRSAEQAAIKAFRSLEGQEWERIDAFPFGLQPVEEVSVTWVQIDEGSLEAELVDTVSETLIWNVRAPAVLWVEGMAYRGDAHALGREWEVSPGDFEHHYVDATRSIRCTLVADVRVEADGMTSEAAVTEILVDDSTSPSS